METHNAKITGTMLGLEDHGIMTFYVFLEWGCLSQGLGGFALDQYDEKTDKRDIGMGAAIVAIRRILETVGVDKWEQLKGQLVRIKTEGGINPGPPIIGHIMEDKWFDLKAFMEEHRTP